MRRHLLLRAPRTVIGYHGCTRETAERVLAGEVFLPSTRAYDWLGVGVYFWEYAPFRAADWARSRFGDEAVVVQATIRLGRCLNLLDVEHFAGFQEAYALAEREAAAKGAVLPQNLADGRHYRDRFMVELYCQLQEEATGRPYQTVRACYPEGESVFAGSRILTKTHVQVAVRDLGCISRLALVSSL